MNIQRLQIHRSVQEWQNTRASFAPATTVGFVPTMGALHKGHRALLERARSENEIVVLSIYVNPTQFDDPQDLQNYPQTLVADLAMAEEAGVDHVILPKYDDLYADNYRYKVTESELSRSLCGAHRPGHFTGVLTIVMKLLNLTRSTRAYFGEKDYQQLQLIKDMVTAFFMQTEIVSCPTVRESDGVAMSSRNTKLDFVGRDKAKVFASVLKNATDLENARATLIESGLEVDYLEEHFGRRFGAVRVKSPKGEVRLIDNVAK
jgi:pantoate--beta-alanine ligase